MLVNETSEYNRQIIQAALRVHSILGPGLLESVYPTCLAHELRKRGLRVEQEVPVPIIYDGIIIDVGFGWTYW
jgi:GxxExxY protein